MGFSVGLRWCGFVGIRFTYTIRSGKPPLRLVGACRSRACFLLVSPIPLLLLGLQLPLRNFRHNLEKTAFLRVLPRPRTFRFWWPVVSVVELLHRTKPEGVILLFPNLPRAFSFDS